MISKPWRPPARLYRLRAAHAAGDQGAGERHDGDARRRHPARHRRDQGAGATAPIRLDRPAVLYAADPPVASPAWRAPSRCCMPRIDRDLALLGIRSSARSPRNWCEVLATALTTSLRAQRSIILLCAARWIASSLRSCAMTRWALPHLELAVCLRRRDDHMRFAAIVAVRGRSGFRSRPTS